MTKKSSPGGFLFLDTIIAILILSVSSAAITAIILDIGSSVLKTEKEIADLIRSSNDDSVRIYKINE